MARILKREPLLNGRHADNLGYVNSVDEAHKLIAEFETGLTTKFSFCKADKGFGNTGVYIYIYIYIDIALWHYKALLSLLCILTSLSSSSPLAWLG